MPATEDTPFRPRSPYAIAKACAHNLITNYREAYQLHCLTGILFNHESPLRPARFVTQKIVTSAARIRLGQLDHVQLGNLDVSRDWGWAPDYVEAMWSMLQLDDPSDFVIATGRTVSLAYFVERAFARVGLDWKAHVRVDETLRRPSDIAVSSANPGKAAREVGWVARHDADHVIDNMVDSAMSSLSGHGSTTKVEG